MANKELKTNKEKKNSFKSLKSELKKVIWPTPKQLINNTLAVVAILIVLSAIVFVLDIAFESANKYGVDKIKQVVVNSNEGDTNTVVETEENANSSEEATTETTTEETTVENTDAE